MKILIATPLYPPEVAAAAAYAKELAARLAQKHEVTVVAYTHLPEPVEGVRVIAVDKRQPRFERLRIFRRALARAAKNVDAVLAINGASVALPVLLTRLPRVVCCIADKAAHARGGLIEHLAFLRASVIVHEIPEPKPEILPADLAPYPAEALAAWEASWQKHLHTLETLFKHGN